MKIEITNITPVMAKAWLGANSNNRPVSSERVVRYARDIATGAWKLSGDAIRFTISGKLLDGQHRLLACVQAKKDFTTLVIFNLPEDTGEVIDTGLKRTAGHVLTMAGHKNALVIAAAAANVWRAAHGMPFLHSGKEVPTHSEILEVMTAHGDALQESYKVVRPLPPMLAGSLAIYLHWAFSAKDKLLADAFMNALIEGTNLSKGDPIFQLREKLLHNSASKAKLPQREIAALVIKAWNRTREGKAVADLRFRSGGGEAFPEIK